MKDFLIQLFIFMCAIVILIQLIRYFTPEMGYVYISNSTKECIRVIPKEMGDCKNLPKHYEIIWVK